MAVRNSTTTSLAAVRIAPEHLHAAAMRLVTQHGHDIAQAASRLIECAPHHHIDLSLIWGVLEPAGGGSLAARSGSPKAGLLGLAGKAKPGMGAGDEGLGLLNSKGPAVRQAVLFVPGSGRTAMTFVSEPPVSGEPGGPETACAERVACLRAGCNHLRTHLAERVRVVLALPEPKDEWCSRALQQAGYRHVGDLAYLRRPMPGNPRADAYRDPGEWPYGVRVVSVDQLPRDQRDAMLITALERSYIDSLDCPEMFGLRDTQDALASHRATGVFDPALWHVVFQGDRPAGCMLFNRCPESRSVELVYLGIGPELRGQKLGSRLLKLGLSQCVGSGVESATCAVDRRNVPALWLYQRAGFVSLTERRAWVLPLRGAVSDAAP